MCFLNLSFPHRRVETGGRGQSGAGRGRVTVCEGRQVELYPQLAVTAPAAQFINGLSAYLWPSLAD